MNKPEFSEYMVSVRPVSQHHTYYVVAELIATSVYDRGEQRIIGRFGIAPNGTTPIEWPVSIEQFGHWNKTQTRQMVAMVKARLLAEIKNAGYQASEFTEPLELRIHSGSCLN